MNILTGQHRLPLVLHNFAFLSVDFYIKVALRRIALTLFQCINICLRDANHYSPKCLSPLLQLYNDNLGFLNNVFFINRTLTLVNFEFLNVDLIRSLLRKAKLCKINAKFNAKLLKILRLETQSFIRLTRRNRKRSFPRLKRRYYTNWIYSVSVP